MKRLKTVAFTILAVLAVAMAAISVGVNFGWPSGLYSSRPMILLWGALAVTGMAYLIMAHQTRRPLTFGIHLALIVILAGALTTHLTSLSGSVSVKRGERINVFHDDDGKPVKLPFSLTANAIAVDYYPGTSTPRDFRAGLMAGNSPLEVSLNHVGGYDGYRFFLKSINPEEGSVTLSVQRDSAGTLISYIGYILLGISMLLFLTGRDYGFRRALRRLTAAVVTMVCATGIASASDVKDSQIAHYMADKMYVYSDERIMPLSSLATDFVENLTGETTVDGQDAEEVYAGFLFHFGDWKERRIIRLKSKEMRELLHRRDGRASYMDFFNAISDGRLDTGHPERMSRKEQEDLARFESVNMLVTGSMLHIFPVRQGGGVVWLSPTDDIPLDLPQEEWLFIRKSMGCLNELIQTGRYGDAADLVDKIVHYQKDTAGEEAFPSPTRLWAERVYVGWFRDCLMYAIVLTAIGLAMMLLIISTKPRRWTRLLLTAVSGISWLYLTAALGLRWMVSGHIPMSDGFETMQFMAWLSSGAALLLCFNKGMLPRLLSGGAVLIAGLCLMVSAMSGGRGNITPLMPVLSSPLLSIHVVLVMISYTLFALMAIASLCGLAGRDLAGRMTDVCRAMLYPAVFLLAAGIFVGAVWANQSWGRYWGWDPKEVWALITMMVYCFPLHVGSLPVFSRPKFFLTYLSAAFFSVLFTYFGVNYLLGGLHSYA